MSWHPRCLCHLPRVSLDRAGRLPRGPSRPHAGVAPPSPGADQSTHRRQRETARVRPGSQPIAVDPPSSSRLPLSHACSPPLPSEHAAAPRGLRHQHCSKTDEHCSLCAPLRGAAAAALGAAPPSRVRTALAARLREPAQGARSCPLERQSSQRGREDVQFRICGAGAPPWPCAGSGVEPPRSSCGRCLAGPSRPGASLRAAVRGTLVREAASRCALSPAALPTSCGWCAPYGPSDA
mmetsp:Transcript_1594/g.5004  ORF Transcript_1594/g.5004 Transcript_1594/m.5004 type:complete len:237 (-) Transcript_1594:1233-1943(-)